MLCDVSVPVEEVLVDGVVIDDAVYYDGDLVFEAIVIGESPDGEDVLIGDCVSGIVFLEVEPAVGEMVVDDGVSLNGLSLMLLLSMTDV